MTPANDISLSEFVIHHVLDAKEWHLPFLPPVPLPGSLTLHGLMMIICALLLLLLFGVVYRKDDKVPTGITNLLEAFILFIRDEIAISFLGEKDGRRMTPLFCTFFFFIAGLNLMGLIPVFSTATSNVNVTAALALITLGFMTVGAVLKNGASGFFKSFVPPDVPWPILVVLVPIEFVGMFVKAFALTIRLFANMLAGHIVILSLLSLVAFFGYVALPSVILAVLISLLEIFIAFLQAFIFTLLSAMFIGQSYHPEH
ncbi:MAG: F0F1 ATP synthase subunit A [Candidatus Omnitrophota bacterium]|nr:F0F1 ATP synthase subunit A [Candidatus Omnitrophota bacterium]MDZ4243333.1 F0F1 ATP synthase subunit A [Candidatus Omnitrophota bacterium]